MLPGLKEIKLRRKQFGLTQSELARQAGVSQSLITKIESGRLIPSYENAKKLFDFLESLHKKTGLKAKDLMSKDVISAKPSYSLKAAIRLMEKRAISQLPIIDKGRVIGTISEKSVLDKLHRTADLNDLRDLNVREVMDDAMPLIQENLPFPLVSSLLEHNQGLLVAKRGKITGIITKADILGVMLKRGL